MATYWSEPWLGALASAPAEAPRWGDFTPAVLAVLVLGLGLIILVSIRGRQIQKQAGALTPRERIDQIKAAAGDRKDVTALNASAYETAQRLAGQLDTKAERLEQLLEQAEARIATLEALLDGDAAPVEPEPAVTESPPAPEPSDPLTRDVYRLAREGRSAVEIAQTLDEQVGKIELILALRG